ncbi:DUF6705 family protein [Chryseobacterium koreense]|mgnify:CR=1 FL=1|uniref:DUF6705 family protein n=1 Tax=Chryseobacterium koreense TaxID=232216 RepID=UPI0026EF7CE6|nr:DUF6705 family protein [Chryseobacterium koreense]
MNTINLRVITFLLLLISIWSCKAQNLPLNTALENIPNNAHIKDFNNDLNPYIGIYKSNFQGNEITLFITKEENKLMNYGNQIFYSDVLVGKYIVKNPLGQILQDTANNNTAVELYSTSISTSQNIATFYYGGTNCGVGWGDIYLKKINTNQISWEYRPDDTIIDSNRCPAGTDINIYLPETKDLIFTKQ